MIKVNGLTDGAQGFPVKALCASAHQRKANSGANNAVGPGNWKLEECRHHEPNGAPGCDKYKVRRTGYKTARSDVIDVELNSPRDAREPSISSCSAPS